MTATAREFLGGVFDGQMRACDESTIAVVVNNFILTEFVQSPASKRGERGQLIPVYSEMFSAYVLRGENFVSVHNSNDCADCEQALAKKARPM